MRPRLLIADAGRLVDEPVRLDAQRSHHLVRVLRLQPGAPLECFDGDGGRFEARLETADARGCTVRVGAALPSATESRLRMTLLQCVSSGERMDWTIEKAVELGVASIQPLLSAHSPQRLDAERSKRRREHWQRLVEAACMQCGRDRLPLLHEARPLERWFTDRTTPAAATSIVLLPDATLALSRVPIAAGREIELLVGPESGLTAREAARAVESGFAAARLGPRTLRTETAGLAALAALQALAGDF